MKAAPFMSKSNVLSAKNQWGVPCGHFFMTLAEVLVLGKTPKPTLELKEHTYIMEMGVQIMYILTIIISM